MLWQYTPSLACTTSVFRGQSFNDSANMAQFWFPSCYASLLVPNFWASQSVSYHKSRKDNSIVHFIFKEKRILSPQYPSFPFLPSNRPKANVNFAKRSYFPFLVVRRHHLVDAAPRGRLHQPAENTPVPPSPSSGNGSIKGLHNENVTTK